MKLEHEQIVMFVNDFLLLTQNRNTAGKEQCNSAKITSVQIHPCLRTLEI